MPGYKVIVDHPNLGEESSLFIHGLGTFKNHTTTEVDLDQVRRFRAAHSTVEVVHDEKGRATHTPSRGPSPADINVYGVTFEKIDGSGDDKSTGEGDN
jgi:hypothetical protein